MIRRPKNAPRRSGGTRLEIQILREISADMPKTAETSTHATIGQRSDARATPT